MTEPAGLASSSSDEAIWVRVDEPSTCAAVRRRAADLARQVGLADDQIEEVAVAASELATNLVKHAREGSVLLRLLRHDGAAGVGVLTLDHGPGTRDIAALSVDGVTTAGTLGIGLGAVRRFADRLDLHSVPGVGTVVSAEFWLRPDGTDRRATSSSPTGDVFGGLTRALHGEDVCGDAYAQRRLPGGRVAMMADGLGHGPMAARASSAAVRAFLSSRSVSPRFILEDLHRALRDTRGAAVAVAHVDHASRKLTYAGIGNIAGRVLDATASSQLPSQPGIVGHNVPTVRELDVVLERGQWLVMHSDGLVDRWNLDDLPGILGSSPVVLCAALLRSAAVRRDDAGVLALRTDGETDRGVPS